MIEAGFWHPVAAAGELAAGQLLAATLLEQPLVLWADETGRAHAAADQCPHRGARLSLGAVVEVDGRCRLQCPYHGWQFGGDGACLRIPAAPELQPTSAQSARWFRTRAAHGLWWVNLSDQDAALPEPAGVPAQLNVCGPFDVATSAPRAIENFLDTAHFGYVHGGWLGDPGHTEVPAYQVELDATGAPRVPHYPAWQPRASSASTEGAWVDYRYQVLGPYAALLVKQSNEPGVPQEAYAIWCCPTTPETTRVWFGMYTSDANADAAQARAFQATIFSQDRPVLESQRPRRLPLSGGEAFGPADKLSAAYRRYLRERQITFGVC